jgi:radical SAM protein with 4Fe4S-binding SPASM domain
LAALGTREITLIGGEAYLRDDWLTIIRSITDTGMYCTLQTGGRNFTEKRVVAAKEAGLCGAGVSIDGGKQVHDGLRGVPGAYEAAISALDLFARYDIVAGVNTTVTTAGMRELRALARVLVQHRARNWHLSPVVPMGNAADNPELLLQPYDYLTLMPLLAELYWYGLANGLLLQPSNTLGYFGPYEWLWRGNGDEEIYWTGCNAGQNTLGIEADGTVKGCPALPTVDYRAGSVRQTSLADIWRHALVFHKHRQTTTDSLWGFCRTCYYADVCRGGCTWVGHSLFGRPGNNPYCHHRALELARRGRRERLVIVRNAPGSSFDFGLFKLVEEPIDAPFQQRLPLPLVAIGSP